MLNRRDFIKTLGATTALVAVPGAVVATLGLPTVSVSDMMWLDLFDPLNVSAVDPETEIRQPYGPAPEPYVWTDPDVMGVSRRVRNPEIPTARDTLMEAWAELNAKD